MGTNNKPVDDVDQAEVLKDPDGTPERHLAAPWILGNLGFFRVHLTIIGPKSKQPKRYLPLSCRQAKWELEALADEIMLLEKEVG